jgi:hypothetical protein
MRWEGTMGYGDKAWIMRFHNSYFIIHNCHIGEARRPATSDIYPLAFEGEAGDAGVILAHG